MTRIGVGAGFAVAFALVLATAAAAKAIVGTPRADVLRGTAKADVIFGRGGNDRLVGLGGNDRINGGRGADRISCGPGRDRVIADDDDTIAADCELVSRPEQPHHSPPSEPPAPGPFAVAGHYVARSEQGRYVHLDVYPDGRLLTNLVVEYDADCTPPLALRGPYLELKADVVIRADRTFGVAATLDNGRTRVSVSGVFDEHGGLAGTFRVQATRESGGARYECDTGVVPFRGGRLLPLLALGRPMHTPSS